MSVAQRTTVASIEANCAGVSHLGSIAREGNRFVILVDGHPVMQAGSFDSAAHRLARALSRALPSQRDDNWGVAARCLVRADAALVFGNLAGGGGGGGGIASPCVARIVAEFRQGQNNLERALEFAARLLASCCGGS